MIELSIRKTGKSLRSIKYICYAEFVELSIWSNRQIFAEFIKSAMRWPILLNRHVVRRICQIVDFIKSVDLCWIYKIGKNICWFYKISSFSAYFIKLSFNKQLTPAKLERNCVQATSYSLLKVEDVTTDEEYSLCALVRLDSVGKGQGYQKCSCRQKCTSKRCACFKNSLGCNSACHPGRSCNNQSD